MAAGMALLGVYNYVRFGNPLEPGLRYTLSVIDLNQLIGSRLLFNAAYLPPNLLYYLLAPLRLRPLFPYVRPVFGELPSISSFLRRLGDPATHHVEDATGLLWVMPFLIASVICAGTYLCQRSRHIPPEGGRTSSSTDARGSSDLLRLAGLLFAAAFLAFAPTLFYFWVATRFMLDFTPLLMLAAAITTWATIPRAVDFPMHRGLLSTIVVATVVSTVCAGLLMAVTGADSRFDDMNPALWGQLLSLFSP